MGANLIVFTKNIQIHEFIFIKYRNKKAFKNTHSLHENRFSLFFKTIFRTKPYQIRTNHPLKKEKIKIFIRPYFVLYLRMPATQTLSSNYTSSYQSTYNLKHLQYFVQIHRNLFQQKRIMT